MGLAEGTTMGFKSRLTPYQRRAIPALEDSIAHWERMAAGTHGRNEGPGDLCCALCATFVGPGPCTKCPVALRTRTDACRETPYGSAVTAFKRRGASWGYSQAALDAEVTYLKETLTMVKNGALKP